MTIKLGKMLIFILFVFTLLWNQPLNSLSQKTQIAALEKSYKEKIESETQALVFVDDLKKDPTPLTYD